MENLKEEILEVVNIYKSGNLDKAEKLTTELIKKNSKVAFLYNLMGLILSGKENFDKAKNYYEEGLIIDPNYAMIYNNLGLLYLNKKELYFDNKKDNENIKKAEGLFKKSISLNEEIPEPQTNLGSLYSNLNKIDDAIECHKKSIKINKRFYFAYLNIANVYVSIGKFNEAKTNLKKAIKIKPDFFEAHRLLSRLTKHTNKSANFLILKKLYAKKNLTEEQKIELCFSLGKANEDIKNYEDSFKFYKEANFLYRKKISFSIEQEIKNIEEIKKLYNLNLFEKFKNSGYKDSSPIFIVGMPRSGSTLVEQILSSHEKVFGGGEIELLPYLISKNFGGHDLRMFFLNDQLVNNEKLESIGKNYCDIMNDNSKKSIITTDKLLNNFLLIGFIKLILPKSKIVHTVRNSKDNIFSIFKNHFPGGKINFAYDMKEIVKYYDLYLNLMTHWENMFSDSIFKIKYENLILNTKTEIKNILSFCDLNWDNNCLNFHKSNRQIKTASDIQARSKIYSSSINSWKKYETNLNIYFNELKN